MQFEPSNLYHIYNRGNNRQLIFFSRENYLYFSDKVKKYICPCCDILAWCLMPNHFHFLVHANDDTSRLVKEKPLPINALTEGIRLLLSSYTLGINKKQQRTGNLFQQKTKYKCVSEENENYDFATFQYIHQNPFAAGLVQTLQDWEFSSYSEYIGSRQHGLCNIKLACSLFNLSREDFSSFGFPDP